MLAGVQDIEIKPACLTLAYYGAHLDYLRAGAQDDGYLQERSPPGMTFFRKIVNSMFFAPFRVSGHHRMACMIVFHRMLRLSEHI